MTELQKLSAQVAASLIGGSVSPKTDPRNQFNDPLFNNFVNTYHKVYAFLERIEKSNS